MNIIKIYNKYRIYIKCVIVTVILLITGILYYVRQSDRVDEDINKDIYSLESHNISSDEDEHMNSSLHDAAIKEQSTVISKEIIYVYVCGEVESPGVVECSKDTRIYEVIQMCGGYTADADINSINPAQKINDGDKIYIPYIGEEYKSEYQVTSVYEGTKSQTGGLININTATKEQLVTLPGIGESRAEDIIRYRSEQGSFKSIEDIKNVSGIKDGAFGKIKDYICV